MAMDVATFAKQLREDGIDAARVEAEKILAESKAKGDKIIADALVTASQRLSTASEEIANLRRRGEAELRFVARDLFLELKRQIEIVATRLLQDKIAGALSTDKVVYEALMEVLKAQKSKGSWELALGPGIGRGIADSVIHELFKTQDAQIKLVEGLQSAGFELKIKDGAQVIEVTESSVAEAFRRLMSPELARFMNAADGKSE